MKDVIVLALSKLVKLDKEKIAEMVTSPSDPKLGDFAFPCFLLAKELKKNPNEIAKELASKIKIKDFEKVQAVGPYVNFFIKKGFMAQKILIKILKEKDKFGSNDQGKNKNFAIDFSSPNIAKPFGIGHLRSTIIGNSLGNMASFNGFKVKRINYLGDWGTQFGKLIVGYKKIGDDKKLKKDPIKYMLELYIEGNKEENEEPARVWFKKLEDGDKEAIKLWKLFKDYSLKDFQNIYSLLGIKFDEFSGESKYYKKAEEVTKELEKKKLLKLDEGAYLVDLETYGLGKCLIKKSDGATLYASRDIAAAIDRKKKYDFAKLVYEVGQEQTLHFKQLFKVLELMGNDWAKDCIHISHGLYLGEDGKRFRTREGNTVFLEEVLNETISLAKKEISKREKLKDKELNERAKRIALSAILYGDLKSFRTNDVLFDIEKFLSFEGDTGPYLLYTYARARSILKKAKYKKSTKFSSEDLSKSEKSLISNLGLFPETVQHSFKDLNPSEVAHYSLHLCQAFNEFYHNDKVIGSENEQFKLVLVDSFSIVLRNALLLLGIEPLEKM